MSEMCKGLIYRAKIYDYTEPKGERTHAIKMILQEKLSCNRCTACDFLKIRLQKQDYISFEHIVHGKLYRLSANALRRNGVGEADEWNLYYELIG